MTPTGINFSFLACKHAPHGLTALCMCSHETHAKLAHHFHCCTNPPLSHPRLSPGRALSCASHRQCCKHTQPVAGQSHHYTQRSAWLEAYSVCVCVQALLAAGQSAKASLCLRVLLESSLEAHRQDVLVLLFLVKAGFQTGSIPSLQTALTHARS